MVFALLSRAARVGTLAVVLTSVVAAATSASPATHTRALIGPTSFAPFAAPAVIAEQPADGRPIKDMEFLGRDLYLGYGDYTGNSGPIWVLSVDTVSGAVTQHVSVPTEEINTYRRIGNALYAPMVDPRVDAREKSGYATNASGTWTNEMVLPGAIHVFDVASLNGSDLWLATSHVTPDGSLAGAGAFRTTDHGATWTQVFQDAGVDTASGAERDRYYYLAPTSGRMWTQARSGTGYFPQRSARESGWTSSGSTDALCMALSGHEVVTFREKVYCTGSTRRGWGLIAFDGRPRLVSSGLRQTYDLHVGDDGMLYALGPRTGSWVLAVSRSSDGVSWSVVAEVPSDTSSVARVGGHLYVGTTAGTVLRAPLS